MSCLGERTSDLLTCGETPTALRYTDQGLDALNSEQWYCLGLETSVSLKFSPLAEELRKTKYCLGMQFTLAALCYFVNLNFCSFFFVYTYQLLSGDACGWLLGLCVPLNVLHRPRTVTTLPLHQTLHPTLHHLPRRMAPLSTQVPKPWTLELSVSPVFPRWPHT